MQVRVRLFARAREVAGVGELVVELPPRSTVQDAFAAAVDRAAGLGSMRAQLLVAVNEDYAEWSTALAPDDVVALIPPVSGG